MLSVLTYWSESLESHVLLGASAQFRISHWKGEFPKILGKVLFLNGVCVNEYK